MPRERPGEQPRRGTSFEDRWPFIRSLLLFVGGFAGVWHEAVARSAERPTLLAAFCVMMGTPIVLAERRKGD